MTLMQQDSKITKDTKRAIKSKPELPVKDVRGITLSSSAPPGWLGMLGMSLLPEVPEFLESSALLELGDVVGASIGDVPDIVQLDPSLQASLHSQQEASGVQGVRVSSLLHRT